MRDIGSGWSGARVCGCGCAWGLPDWELVARSVSNAQRSQRQATVIRGAPLAVVRRYPTVAPRPDGTARTVPTVTVSLPSPIAPAPFRRSLTRVIPHSALSVPPHTADARILVAPHAVLDTRTLLPPADANHQQSRWGREHPTAQSRPSLHTLQSLYPALTADSVH